MYADAIHPNPEVARRLEHLYVMRRADMDLRLGPDTPYGILLAKLGNPHLKLPPVVHVAGTNGKGSTVAFIRAMVEAAGYKTHVYTSPHLLRFNERIRLAGELITDDHFIELYDRVLKINGDEPATFFEFTTALTFLAFTETPADIVLLEVGMGGRLDCSNVIVDPAVTVITKISYDHTQWLGDTLPLIAAEKAGIMKPDAPCVIGPQMDIDAVLPVFEQHAKRVGAPLLVAGRDFTLDIPVTPNLVGAHQIENAATSAAAAAVLKARGFTKLTESRVNEGLQHAYWPGRMERITSGPVASTLPAGWELWFDGAHNDSGAMALADQLRVWKQQDPHKPIHLIAGMSAHKEPKEFFEAVAGAYDTLTLVDLPTGQKPQTGATLKERAGLTGDVRLASDAAAAIAALPPEPAARAVAAGSLYLYQTLFSS